MAFKFIVLSALLLASVSALHLYRDYDDHSDDHSQEHYSHPQYKFAYKVEDHHTGDIKSQEESRDGDRVEGSYSLVEPDGTLRVVHYTADKHIGFHATVHRQPPVHHHDLHQQAPLDLHDAGDLGYYNSHY